MITFVKKLFTLIWLVIKYKNFSCQIFINAPDYDFRYVVQIDKNNYYNSSGHCWVSDEIPVTDLVIDK